ncbi:MAG: type II secretion system ATPase GspE [Pseudomonadota bacterium]
MSDTTPQERFSYAFAKDTGVMLLERENGRAVIGVRGRPSPWALIEARRAARAPLDIRTLTLEDFEKRLSETYAVAGVGAEDLAGDLEARDDLAAIAEDLPQTADLLDASDDAPVIRLINAMIAEAVRGSASDIHIEPFEQRLSVRLRVDGVMREIISLPAKVAPALVSRVKVMSRLDIAEKRTPQDGRLSITLGGRGVDVRVSTLPARYGERVVMRLLDKDRARLDITALGMPDVVLSPFKELLERPNGVLLVTGPTGSGKTTTLYAGLSLLNDETRNILTVEDPIEYALEGVGQTQVNAKVGMTFAAGLRAILRQDPDIVMVGEIRDVETAQIAVQASLTGHLVLSTVHTNSAVGAVTRLRDMGVEPFLLSSTIAGVLAQRLVRRLCEVCKEPYEADAAEKKMVGADPNAPLTLYRPKGCAECGRSGYQGRLGVYELFVVDEPLRRMIHDDASEQDIAAYAYSGGGTLADSGFAHVRAGRTTIEEVLRVARPEAADDAVV